MKAVQEQAVVTSQEASSFFTRFVSSIENYLTELTTTKKDSVMEVCYSILLLSPVIRIIKHYVDLIG